MQMTLHSPPLAPKPGACLARRTRVFLVMATVGVAAAALWYTPGKDRFAPDRIATALHGESTRNRADSSPYRADAWVSPANFTPSAHSCATTVLPNGDLLAVWFGGSREGAGDVALYTAHYEAQRASWTAPIMVVDRSGAQKELGRVIRKIGNATIFPDRNGTLWLVYVTVTLGGWSGSALNVKSSRDDGRTWSESQRLNVNPFFNLSSLVRNKPVYTDDGRIGLPIYHEMAMSYPQMLWFTPTADGRIGDYVVRRMPAARGLIQPTIVPLKNNRAAVLFRDHTSERKLRTAYSDDNGWTWSNPSIGLPNADAAVDALRLRDGRMLLVYNASVNGRENLQLAVSADDGTTWIKGAVIEHEAGEEFSYPCLVEDQAGRIHLTYTWKRQRIKHVTFNLAWLAQSLERGVTLR